MNHLIAGAGVVNQTPLDWTGNRDRLISTIQQARSQGVQALCLPELAISGYGCEDMFHAPWVWRRCWQSLKEIIPHCQGLITGLGLPVSVDNRLYNAIAVVVDAECVGFVAKQKLAGDGIHYEPRWFKPWESGQHIFINTDLGKLPFGDVCFDIAGLRLGFEIYEDSWVADRPGIRLMERGADLIFNPSASHFSFGKRHIRQRFVLEGSRAFGVGYVYANLLGNEAGRAIYDGSSMIASEGRLLAEGTRFSFRDTGLICHEINLQVNRGLRSRIFSNQKRAGISNNDCGFIHHVEILPETLEQPVTDQATRSGSDPVSASELEDRKSSKHEEFTRAVALGLMDYMRKTSSRGFVLSLSGGADSAAVACLVGGMVQLGINELGSQTFMERCRFPEVQMVEILQTAPSQHVQQIIKRLLTTLYQGTENSSQTTRNAAKAVAEGLGAEYLSTEIQEIVQQYHRMVSGAIGRDLSWEQDDIALQNIQARVRSPGVWMIANIKGGLLLSTSNRSEAAVGYATMDGDTSGGLSPIAGIDKAYLREWLKWMEETGPECLQPLPFLRWVNEQSPTAELRPQERHQTDEEDLMPYPVLNRIESLALRDLLPPEECLDILISEMPSVEPEQLKGYVQRFFSLWCRNQWKRERYAPSFHLDDRNLDPRTWCRFPILNSGFKEEIQNLPS